MKARYVLIAVAVLFVAGALAASSYAKTGLEACVGMWLFDEDSDDIVTDSSGNGNDGQLKGGPKWVDGKFGKAFEFDGPGDDDYVDAGNLGDQYSTAFSVVFWSYLKSLNTRNTWVIRGASMKEYFSVVARDTTDMYCLIQWDDNSRTWLDAPKGTVVLDTWQHYTITYDGSVRKIYLNGNQIVTDTPNKKLKDGNYQFTIGKEVGEAEREIDGLIDEVAIFNVALAEDDIRNIMNDGLSRTFGLTAVDLSGKLTITWANIKAR